MDIEQSLSNALNLIPPDESFTPPTLLGGGFVQTLLPFLLGSGRPAFKRHRLELPDGDFVDLDSIKGRSARSVVLMLHGLEGSSASRYISSSANTLLAAGFSICAMNYRGCSGELNRLLPSYHSGKTDDVFQVLQWLAEQYEEIFILGFSVGGNIALKLLGEFESPQALKCVVCISVPLSLIDCADELSKPQNRIYMGYFLKQLVPKIRQKSFDFGAALDVTGIDDIETFWEFDERYTAPLSGFSSALEYYSLASSLPYLKYIRKPTLIISALDDPFLGPHCFPSPSQLPRQVVPCYPKQGGHVGFIDFRRGTWVDRVAARCFEAFRSR
jgi:predicted alpha/beta-fold hydrolase